MINDGRKRVSKVLLVVMIIVWVITYILRFHDSDFINDFTDIIMIISFLGIPFFYGMASYDGSASIKKNKNNEEINKLKKNMHKNLKISGVLLIPWLFYGIIGFLGGSESFGHSYSGFDAFVSNLFWGIVLFFPLIIISVIFFISAMRDYKEIRKILKKSKNKKKNK